MFLCTDQKNISEVTKIRTDRMWPETEINGRADIRKLILEVREPDLITNAIRISKYILSSLVIKLNEFCY